MIHTSSLFQDSQYSGRRQDLGVFSCAPCKYLAEVTELKEQPRQTLLQDGFDVSSSDNGSPWEMFLERPQKGKVFGFPDY